MYFKRIEMHGFKSFAEPVVIEFHEGVTCIVGPNGSGKSNISDAIRWVLGEQSPKMLRGGKMEEVIFAGTASRKSRGMAEVTLVIDNSTGILPIDYSEVAITRRMYRSGESEYLINNNQCRLRDIKELIMDTGIGVDGYSIIGQGKIADIVSNKPESRREIFEEAAGVVMYKSKKAEAERKLQNTNANLERVNDIVGEIEGRIDGLREDSTKAKEYLELREKYKELEINITLKNIEKLDLATETLKDDAGTLSADIEELSAKKESLSEELAESRSKNDRLEELGNEARDKLLAKVEEINAISNKSQLDKERLSAIEKDTLRLTEEAQELNEKLVRELGNLKELEESREEVRKSLETEEEKLREKIDAYNEITEKSLAISDEIDGAKNRMIELHSKASSRRSEAKSLESYRGSLEKRKAQILSDGQAIKQNIADYEKDKIALTEDKEAASSGLLASRAEISKTRSDISGLNAEINSLSKENEDLRIRAGQANARKKTIEEMEHNYEGYNGAVKFIMKAGISGIKGVVADLMKVPSGMEVAIETALGAGMQNIVCAKDADAKTAINRLKENKAGRLTFLPLESIHANRASVPPQVKQAPGFKGLACDLIEYDDTYAGIFGYLLGRVAVVDNMDTAVNLSKKAGGGIRFVTPEGEIINASGAITGGKYRNSTANLLARKTEISTLEKEIRALKRAYRDNEDKLAELKAEADSKRKHCVESEEQARNFELSVFEADAKLKSLEDNYKDTKENNEKKVRELESIKKDFTDLAETEENLLKEAAEAEREIKALDEVTERLMDSLEEVKEKVQKAGEEITNARIAKTTLDSEFEAAGKMLERVNGSVEEINAQLEGKQLSIDSLEKEKSDILFGNEDSEDKYRIKSEEKARLEEYIAEISEEKAQLSSTLGRRTAEFTEIGDKLNSYRDKKYQIEIKLAKNETQMDTWKEKLWEDFEISYAQAVSMKKSDFVLSAATKESREIKNRMRELGDVNIGSIREYEQISTRYEFLTEQRGDILEAMRELQSIISDMDKTIKTRFKENFDQVVVNFEEIFKELFGGGHAELRLDNEENPLESGIDIIAQPPGKKLQNINLMSGGEKTMTAIALMFAVLKTKPTPFCILDEVEAALDDNNIDRFANYLRKFSGIQFAIVTHQKATMEHADVLYGVTMPEQGISKVLSLRLGDDFEI